MKKQSFTPITNEQLLEIFKSEKEKHPYVYTDRLKAAMEMLRMRGVKIPA